MGTLDKKEKNTHHGHAIKRFRHNLGMKQDVLASELKITQAMVSMYESKKVIDDNLIGKFAKVLGVDPQHIKDLEEDPVTVIIENNNNTFGENDKINQGYIGEDNSVMTINPVEKIAELFERLLEKEQEKIVLLEKLLKEKK